MQEIAILLSSIAGIATAVAVRHVPRGRQKLQSLGASSKIKSQISALEIERDILAKTISRLHVTDSGYTKMQKDRLLAKYQHQLGVILARLERLEQASRHPDLGPVGDGLITLMDQKLSSLDNKLQEISTRMAATEKPPAPGKETKLPEPQDARQQEPQDVIRPKPQDAKRPERQKTIQQEQEDVVRPERQQAGQQEQETAEPVARIGRGVEITTLTSLPEKEPEFPQLVQPGARQPPKADEVQAVAKQRQDKPPVRAAPTPERPDITKNVRQINAYKALTYVPEHAVAKSSQTQDKLGTVTEPKSRDLPAEDEFDSDTDDLAKIKHDIQRVLAKIDQAEVE